MKKIKIIVLSPEIELSRISDNYSNILRIKNINSKRKACSILKSLSENKDLVVQKMLSNVHYKPYLLTPLETGYNYTGPDIVEEDGVYRIEVRYYYLSNEMYILEEFYT